VELRIVRNSDETITVRVGRAVEHIGVEGKTRSELFDAVKYALISKGANVSEAELAELLYRLRDTP
jgi:hypothetical protein